MKDFAKLLQIWKTVFSVADIYQIFPHLNKFSLRNLISRMGKQWLLHNIRKGIRSLPHYNEYELANMLQKPSYISLETVLYKEGIVFQDYGHTIFSISMKTHDYAIQWKIYSYKTITSKIALDPLGINHQQGYAIASAERALCDRFCTSHQIIILIIWEALIETKLRK